MLAKKLFTPLAAILPMGAATAAPAQSNVLVILVDDLGWNDLGCMGSDYYETPNIDRLAQRGVLFTNGYAACQVSSPSRASILTGKFTTNHGVTNFIGAPTGEAWRKRGRFTKMIPPEYGRKLPLEDITLAEQMQASGYKTLFAGKWHLGGEGSTPIDHGFDVNIGGWASGSPAGGYFSPWKNPALPNEVAGENLTMRLSREMTTLIAEHTKRNKKQPFFALLSFYAVHSPIQTSQERWQHFRDKAERMGINEEGFVTRRAMPERQHQDNPVYAGLVQSMDDAVGYLLDAIERMGIDKNTLIIFTSDNGGVVSGDSFSTSLAPLRGGKGMQWEGGLRVPFIVRTPTGQSGVCDTPVSGVDIYPTIVDWAGVEMSPSQKVDGVSITPLLEGDTIAARPLFWHYPHYGNQGGEPSGVIRDGVWKLIRYYEDNRVELYNLDIDISELEPLNHLYPERVADLSAKLNTWLCETNAIMPTADVEYSPQKEAELKERWRTSALRSKEKERANMLSPTWSPNATWWDSKVTED